MDTRSIPHICRKLENTYEATELSERIGPKGYFDFSAPTIMGADLPTWLRMLWMYKSEIHWKFIPRIFSITFMILLYAPLRWWEWLRYERKIKRTEVKAPVFIIGHQRSGTTYLHYLMGRDPQFGNLTVKESFMPWICLSAERHLEWLLGRSMPDKRPMDNLKLGMDLPTEPEYALGNMTWATMIPGYTFPKRLDGVFRRTVLFEDESAKRDWQRTMKYFMQKLTLKNGGKRLIIKAPENLGRVRELLEIFPDAKFVHIHRDPYRVYFSTERLYGITIPLVAMQWVGKSELQEFILSAYERMFHKYFQDRDLIPDGNLTEMRYDDLIGNEVGVIKQAYGELGLEGFDAAKPFILEEVKQYENYETNTYKYPRETMDKVYSRWKDIFERLGYSEK